MSADVKGHVDVLLFRVGGARYGVDATQVRRIQREGFRAEIVDALGTPETGARALVFGAGSEEAALERQICVDEVEGLARAAVADLRRIPASAGSVPGVLGVWLEDGHKPVVLVDLPTFVEDPGA